MVKIKDQPILIPKTLAVSTDLVSDECGCYPLSFTHGYYSGQHYSLLLNREAGPINL